MGSHAYYIFSGIGCVEWQELKEELSHLQLEYKLFGFSNKEAHVFLSENVAKELKEVHKIRLDGPYFRID